MGCLAGAHRKKSAGEGSHYFLAGNTLGWPIIGLAMFAANISTVHLVSFAETAYKHGMVYGNFEWMAGFTLILLSLFFAPLYLRSSVATLPDFLERRYNRHCRDWLTVISLFSAIVIHIGVALWTAAIVLRGILGIEPGQPSSIDPMMFFVIVLGVLTGVYTMIGGLLAVVWTESIQTVLLLVGAVCITVVGYHYVGGWGNLKATLATLPPSAGRGGRSQDRLQLADRQLPLHPPRSVGPQPPALAGNLAGLSGDRHLVLVLRPDHRAAGAGRKRRQKRAVGPAVLRVPEDPAGVPLRAARRLLRGPCATGQRCLSRPGPHRGKGRLHVHGHAHAALGLKGPGDRGHAGGGHANLFRRPELGGHALRLRHRRPLPPKTSDHQLVLVGKITTVVGTVLAIVSSPIFGQKDTVFQALTDIICYISPPVTAVFLFGVFWKRTSSRAAFLALVQERFWASPASAWN